MLQRLVGNTVLSAHPAGGRYSVRPPAGFGAWQMGPLGRLLAVEAKGKFMWWRLGDEADAPEERWHMFCTYGMTGGWVLADRTPHETFRFVLEAWPGAGPIHLTFDDVRHFGTLKFVRGQAALDRKLGSLGPDMLSAPPDPVEFACRILRRPRVSLAEALMDQATVSGVGNYVKAESLWRARLSPHRPVHSLAVEELVALREAVVGVLQESYALHGATIASYRDPDGQVGHASSRFACYGRQRDPDGFQIVTEETSDGRTTWWCPERQK